VADGARTMPRRPVPDAQAQPIRECHLNRRARVYCQSYCQTRGRARNAGYCARL